MTAYKPTPAEDEAQRREWLERSAIESDENVEAQWERTFRAADADPFNGPTTYSSRPELNRPGGDG